MNQKYYALKCRIGGEKSTAREKLCWHWYPTPGCNIHASIIGERRAEILFRHYCGSSRTHSEKANLLYWRTHPSEWNEIQCRIARKK